MHVDTVTHTNKTQMRDRGMGHFTYSSKNLSHIDKAHLYICLWRIWSENGCSVIIVHNIFCYFPLSSCKETYFWCHFYLMAIL